MKRMKFLAVLVASTIIGTLFTGCSGSNQTQETVTKQEETNKGTTNKETISTDTKGPEKQEPQTYKLSVLGTEGWAPCNNFNEREEFSAWKILQSKFDEVGLDIEWEVVAAEQYAVVLQTRLASGNDLPDLAKAHTMDNASILALADQGMVLPINDMIEKYSNGNIKKMYDEVFTTVEALNTAEDGNMYWFSNVQTKYYEDNPNADGTFTILYRKDWADTLGIAEPTNLAEFTQMLRDFRSKDANGNGKADEILNIDVGTFRTAIAQWFDLGTGNIAIDPDNKKVISPWKQENVKAYFTYINELVNEGIIDASVTGNYELASQKMAENKVSAGWDYSNAPWLEPQVITVAPDVLYVPLMPLEAIEGVKPAGMSEPGSLVWEKYIVTKGCKNPEAVIKLMDIVHTDEYGTLTAFGEEGKNFTYVDDVITPIEGLTADVGYEKRVSEGAMIWNGVLPRLQRVDMRQQVAGKDEYKTKVTLDMVDYDKKYPDQLDNFLAIPTAEEIAIINELQTNVDTYARELATKLALGKIPVDQLDAEVAKLDELGLSKLMEIAQARYDRYLAKLPQ